MTPETELLDLRRHDLEDVPGKTVFINCVPYTILDLIGQGGEANVYRIRNQRTQEVLFVLNVFLFTPEAPEYEAIRHRGDQTFQSKAYSSSDRDPSAKGFLSLEIYEQNGGLLGFQRYVGRVRDPEEYQVEMSKAGNLTSEGRDPDAVQIFNEVLAHNPNHVSAMCSKGVCLGRAGDIPGGLQLFLRCIELEPNMTVPYHNAGIFLVNSGRPEDAIQILNQALDRYAADFETWLMLVNISTEYDGTELVDDIIDWGLKLISKAKISEHLRARIEESMARSEHYRLAFERAVSAQSSQHWDDAMPYFEEAIAASKRNAIAQLNFCICLFHKGRIKESVQRLRTILHRIHGAPAFASGALLLVGWAHLGEWDTVRFIALDFYRRFERPADLPRIPLLATYDCCLELPNVDRIVSTLSAIPSHLQCPASDMKAFEDLRKKYQQLAATEFTVMDEKTISKLLKQTNASLKPFLVKDTSC
jgi:tetratricopeptide (TPR) repeat protein